MEEQHEESTLSDSWVTLSLHDDSECNGIALSTSYNSDMEQLLFEAQREGSTPSISRNPSNSNSLINSPPRVTSNINSTRGSPYVSGLNSPATTKVTELKEALPILMRPENNSDWVWDWSSQPTNTPPKESLLRHPKPKRTSLSLRNTEVMKYNFFSWNFLQIFIPSMIVSNILTFGIGYVIGSKMASAAKNN